MKTTLAALLLGLMTIAVTGCNTTRGFGQDVEAAGEAIEEAAENTKEKISN
jgi:entericidin B